MWPQIEACNFSLHQLLSQVTHEVSVTWKVNIEKPGKPINTPFSHRIATKHSWEHSKAFYCLYSFSFTQRRNNQCSSITAGGPYPKTLTLTAGYLQTCFQVWSGKKKKGEKKTNKGDIGRSVISLTSVYSWFMGIYFAGDTALLWEQTASLLYKIDIQ